MTAKKKSAENEKKKPAGDPPAALPKTDVAKARVKQSGKNTRVKGHLSATTRRQQARRDSKNP